MTAVPVSGVRPGDLLFGKYRVDRLLGRGAMGEVFLARHEILDKTVAVKVVPAGGDARSLAEARLAAAVQSPHVVAVHDVEAVSPQWIAIVMEYVQGPTLAQLIQTEGPLPLPTLAISMVGAARGLSAAAARHVVHRDVKPANLLITSDSITKVADFGLARRLEGHLPVSEQTTISALICGTPAYMAPEQVETPDAVDHRADIYGFGATFFHAATGRTPFAGSITDVLYAHKHRIPEPPRGLRTDLPQETSEVIERCLAKSPTDRFQTFDEVLAALDRSGPAWDETGDPAVAALLAQFGRHREAILEGTFSTTPVALFSFEGGRRLEVVNASITQVTADAWVSSDDEQLTMGGGVSGSINAATGFKASAEVQKYVPVRLGGVVVSSAGISTAARFVLHAVSIDYSSGTEPSRDVILSALHGCLYHVDVLNLRSLAVPLIGTGAGRFSPRVAVDTIVAFFVRTLLRRPSTLERVTIVVRGTTHLS